MSARRRGSTGRFLPQKTPAGSRFRQCHLRGSCCRRPGFHCVTLDASELPLQIVTVVPSNFVRLRPVYCSLKHPCSSVRNRIATASPSLKDSVASVRQCTPAMFRPTPTLAASLFNSPPTVNGGPL